MDGGEDETAACSPDKKFRGHQETYTRGHEAPSMP